MVEERGAFRRQPHRARRTFEQPDAELAFQRGDMARQRRLRDPQAQRRAAEVQFVGDDHESVATAFIDGDEVLLVDALGSAEDALWLRRVLCEEMGKTVRMVVSTHFMSDHIAGLPLFADALTLAHRHHLHTYLLQNQRVDALYRQPRLLLDGDMSLRWGRHELRILHNPGKTLDHLCVDVPSADLVCAGDNIVGNIVYLSKADPAMIRAAIARIALALADADQRRDIEAFADDLDAIVAVSAEAARSALAPLTLHHDLRLAIAALTREAMR